jgi:hypothetical protein
MIHCFLVYENYRVDLTEGNSNGKNRFIKEFVYIQQVAPNISAKDEYLLYRKATERCCLEARRAFSGRPQAYPSERRNQTLEGKHSMK